MARLFDGLAPMSPTDWTAEHVASGCDCILVTPDITFQVGDMVHMIEYQSYWFVVGAYERDGPRYVCVHIGANGRERKISGTTDRLNILSNPDGKWRLSRAR